MADGVHPEVAGGSERERPPAGAPEEAQVSDRYRHLPEPVHLEDTIATKDPDPAPDPNGGRDPDRDFMLRYGAGL